MMKKLETSRRIIRLFLSLVGLAVQTAGFVFVWFNYYKPMMEARQIRFWIKGDLLLIAIYAIILLLISEMYGGMRIGYLKTWDVFFSQVFSTLGTDVIMYAVLSLMYTKLITYVVPMFALIGAQVLWVAIWTAISNMICSGLFPPRNLLLVSGDRPTDDIERKFGSRPDKYRICKKMTISEGLEAITEEIEKRYDGMIIWDIPTGKRNQLLKYCYGRSIRVYVMPKISDVLVKGTDELHIFDTPIYFIREYALTVEQRLAKRCIDVVCSFILIILTSPFMLLTAIIIKCYDGGPVLYHQTRCTIGARRFEIYKFRSMRVDAEKDGVARLASKGDDRITPVGKVIRTIRFDELPQLFNILKGDMSFIGPRPERPEIIEQYTREMPEFVFRMKVKAGLAGYAQVYGKYNTTPYDKLKLDLAYIENYSVWLDLKLMLLTLKVLLSPDSTEGVESGQITAEHNSGNGTKDSE